MHRIRDAFHSVSRVKVWVQQENIRAGEMGKTTLMAIKANTLHI